MNSVNKENEVRSMKQAVFIFMCVMLCVVIQAGITRAAYHHEGERDSPRFIEAYPMCAGTKLDSCVLCHTGGSYENQDGTPVSVGTCQWCHRDDVYGYQGRGDIAKTLNGYGRDYLNAGRSSGAFSAIEANDSDGDRYTNREEIASIHYPGDALDDPTKEYDPAPRVTYSLEEIEKLPAHTQFMLMNTARSGDFYAEYQGVTLESLLDDAGILPEATSVTVFSPDGYSYTHDLFAGGQYYPVYGVYTQASFYYSSDADKSNGGWCDYSSPAATGRSDGDIIDVDGGLRLLLAYKRDGAYLLPGYLDDMNRLGLDAEGPFRAVPPQIEPGPPDQSATHYNQNVYWPYDETLDHNAGYSTRAVVAVRVDPLPEGTEDFNWHEGGWTYVENKEIIVYGALASGEITGMVTDNGTGNAVEGCRVTADSGSYAAVTLSDGSYRLPGMKPGAYLLSATVSGYRTQSQRVSVGADTVSVADFAMVQGTGSGCPIETAIGGDPETLDRLRRFRDEVLNASQRGRNVVELYYAVAGEVNGILHNNPGIRNEAARLIYCLVPFLPDDSTKDIFFMPDVYRARMAQLVDMITSRGSPTLRALVRQRLGAVIAGVFCDETTQKQFFAAGVQ